MIPKYLLQILIMVLEIMAEHELVKKKKGTTSYVWTFFKMKKDGSQDSEQAICRLC